MKSTLSIPVFIAMSLLAAEPALAGGVSDGGGNTTNLNPTDPSKIALNASKVSHLIMPWLFQQQSQFASLSPADKTKSLVVKLFPAVGKNIIQITKETAFEIRMSEPCRDVNGQAKDASIYGTKPRTLCLSPFLMAPKLNDYNVSRETAALMIHELSHLFGTTEDEANAIQNQALSDFNQNDISNTMETIHRLLGDGLGNGKFDHAILPLEFWMSDPERHLTLKDSLYWMREFRVLGEDLLNQSASPKFQFVPMELMSAYGPQNVKLAVIALFISASEKTLDPVERKAAQDLLDKTFISGNTQTARQIIKTQQGVDPGVNYDLVVVRQPQTWQDIGDVLKELHDYLVSVQRQVKWLDEFYTPIYVRQ